MPDDTNKRRLSERQMSEMEFVRAMMRGAIEPLYPVRAEDLGLTSLEELADMRQIIETLCGGDDSQDVESYDGTLGVTVGFVASHEQAVGQLQWNNNLATIYASPGDVSGARWGSGTLIARNLFLTAGHCFDQTPAPWTVPRAPGTMNPITPAEIALNMHVNFNYQFDAAGNLRTEDSYPVTALVEYRLGNLDFAIVRLAGDPGLVYGTTPIATADAAIGDMLCIIQHPNGVPKRIEAGPLSDFVGDMIRYNDIDTLGGTSGSGILGPDGTIVGVHTNGGCTGMMIGHNFGVRISSIRANSPTIQGLGKQNISDQPIKTTLDGGGAGKLKLHDEVPKHVADLSVLKKITDDPSKVKLLDDPVNTGVNNLKSKRIDDPKDKVVDDPKSKFDEDPKPLNSDPPGINKGFNDPGGGTNLITLRETPSRAPFILATPHHALAAAQPSGNSEADEHQLRAFQAQLAQLEQSIRGYAAEQSRLEAIYRQMLSEFQASVEAYSARLTRGR